VQLPEYFCPYLFYGRWCLNIISIGSLRQEAWNGPDSSNSRSCFWLILPCSVDSNEMTGWLMDYGDDVGE